MKPIAINSKTVKTCFKFKGCDAQAQDITISVNRVGSKRTIIYPALSLEDGLLCFAWDYALYNSPNGRYIGWIKDRKKRCKPLCVHFQLGCECTISEGLSLSDIASCKECG